MTARVIPFRTSSDLRFTLGERRTAAVWCAFRGPAWSTHTMQSATGYTMLGIVTPGRKVVGNETAPAWLVQKMPAGLLLTDAVSGRALGAYPSIADVLAAVTVIEGDEAVNDNQRELLSEAADGAAFDRPCVEGTGPRRQARSGSSQCGRMA